MNHPKYELALAHEIKMPFKKEDFSSLRPTRRRRFMEITSNCFKEFARNTSIHGFKYLGARPIFERVWWITILSLCIYTCISLTLITLKKREENPVFVSFRQSPLHVWDIPFPAVTICPATQIKATKYNYTEFHERVSKNNLTTEEMQRFMDMSMFCVNKDFPYIVPPEYKHEVDQESISFVMRNAPSVDEVLHFCRIHKGASDCHKHFSPILTRSGLCFSFNMLDKTDLFQNITYLHEENVNHRKITNWDYDNNFVNTLNSTIPERITSVTDTMVFGLRNSDSDVVNLCQHYKGYQVIFHHPASLPILTNRYLLLSTNENYKIWIKPDITTTSTCLYDYYPDKRGCFFSKERDLKYFRIYTEENCKVECIANLTETRCGCVPFYLPREKSTRLCGLNDETCVLSMEEAALNLEMKIKLFGSKSTQTICNCLPSCISILYNAESSPKKPSISAKQESSYTAVYITFKDSTFMPMERNELFSSVDFWASFGGLLGLFTGFSVVSLAEIIYFFTIKWIWYLWRSTQEIW